MSQPASDGLGEVGLGSGYLLDDGLVLTAAHVVDRGSTALVRIGASSTLLRCEVIWRRYDQPTGIGVDAALLRVVDDRFTSPAQRPVRWGRLVTTDECPIVATGFPLAMAMWRDRRLVHREPAQIAGTIMPGSRRKADRFEAWVKNPVPSLLLRGPAKEVTRWSGMSGSVLMASGALVGLVVSDPDLSGNALSAVPVESLLSDLGFRALVGAPRSVPVELDAVLERPPPEANSPIGLLRADVAAVDFHGRDDVVRDLLVWCTSPANFGVKLVTGPAGSGKTRLACEMINRMRAQGWCAGFLSVTCSGEQMGVLADLTEPLLLVVDYAETKNEQLRSLLERIEAGGGHHLAPHGIRLLLLARSEGEWWGRLRTTTRTLRALSRSSVLPLLDLEHDVQGRLAAFHTAVADLRSRLAALPDYQSRAESLDLELILPPRLDHPGYARALTIQVAALAALLRRLSPVDAVSDEPDEMVLLEHEGRFWAGTVQPHGIAHLHDSTLRSLVAMATLCPVTGQAEAHDLLGRLSLLRGETANTLRAVAAWLHELYAAEDGYWSALVPDALGEYLVGTMSADFDELLDDLAGRVDHDQAEQMVSVLSGASARFPALTDSLVRHVIGRPRPIAFAALSVVVRGEHAPLHVALGRLVESSSLDARLAEDLLDAVPQRTLALANVAVRLAERLVEFGGTDVAGDEGSLLALAEARRKLAFRLAESGRHDDALDHVVEAVALSRAAIERFGTDQEVLADSLMSWGARLAKLGRWPEALRAVDEALPLCRTLDLTRGEPTDLERLAVALHHQAAWLHGAEKYPAAARAGAAAVRIRTRLAGRFPRYRAVLASSTMNYGIYLRRAGRPEDGLVHARAAVDAHRPMAEESPDEHLLGLGRALLNLGLLLADLGEMAEAVVRAEEAVHVYRQFVQAGTVGPKAELAIALTNYGKLLAARGRPHEALKACEEAFDLWLVLAAADLSNADAHLAVLEIDLLKLRRIAERHPGGD